MKTLSVILIAFFMVSCSDPASPSAPLPVSLTFIDHSEFDAKLLLKNNTTESLLYWGFSKSSPLKTVEVLSDTGWAVVVWDWCGTGAEQQEVKPNESVIIFAPIVKKNVTTRMAFSYRTPSNQEFIKLTSSEYIIK